MALHWRVDRQCLPLGCGNSARGINKSLFLLRTNITRLAPAVNWYGYIMQRLGEKLRTLRKHHNMTLIDLAEALGYASHGYLSLIETGKKKPSAEFVWKVAQLFNISTDQLLRDDLDIATADTENTP